MESKHLMRSGKNLRQQVLIASIYIRSIPFHSRIIYQITIRSSLAREGDDLPILLTEGLKILSTYLSRKTFNLN